MLIVKLGLTGQLSDLDAESLDILRSSFESNKQWADKGSFLGTRPPPLNAGRVVIEIFPDVPKAAENFKCLCSGERGKGKSSGKPLHYLGTKFHRIVKGFVCQGGDIVRGDGSGGDSIYGGKFNDEQAGLKRKHTGAGVVGFANSGKNSNTSQFYMTLSPAPKCDGKHVVIGQVVEGLDILTRIDEEAASADGTPRIDVAVGDCGVL
eukprot:jgi/Botrbrau1/3269/Bobra.174_1s0039.2